MLKRIPNQESSGTLTGLKAVPRKLSLVSVTAVITSGYMESGEKELCSNFPSSLENAKACCILSAVMPCLCGLFLFVCEDAFSSALLDPLRDIAGKCKVRREIQPPLTTALTSYHITDRTPPALPPSPWDPLSTDHT